MPTCWTSLALLLTASLASATPFEHRPRFTRYGIDDGLSQSVVLAFHQDRRGFIWIGTQDGLNRFDGTGFETFRPEASRPSESLPSGYVLSFLEDSAGFLWIGTNGGLSRFDPSSETFVSVQPEPERKGGLGHAQLFDLAEDPGGALWIATGGGLERMTIENGGPGLFEQFRHDPGDPTSLAHDSLSAVLLDREGTLWVASRQGGLARAKPPFEPRPRFSVFPSGSLPSNYIRVLHEDPAGRIWVGTGEGLCKLLEDGESFQCFEHDASDTRSLSQGVIWSLATDPSGRLWVGTEQGLNRLEVDGGFERFLARPRARGALQNDFVNALFSDRSGVVWIGTDNGAHTLDTGSKAFRHLFDGYQVYSFLRDRSGRDWVGTSEGLFGDRPRGEPLHFRHDPEDPTGLSHSEIRSLHEDRAGFLWIGTYDGGLSRLDPERATMTRFTPDSFRAGGFGRGTVAAMVEDKSATLWVGTTGGGLHRYLSDSEGFLRFRNDPKDKESLSHDSVVALAADQDGGLWVGTHHGLDYLAPGERSFQHYRHRQGDPASLSHDRVLSISQTRDGSIWVGTAGGGLGRLDREHSTFQTLTVQDGLPNNVVYGIVEDGVGHLWISTNRGLARLEPKSGELRLFDFADGLQANEFNLGASSITADGEVFLGGINGLSAFFPSEIIEDPRLPYVRLRRIRLFNRLLEAEEEGSAYTYGADFRVGSSRLFGDGHSGSLWGYYVESDNEGQKPGAAYGLQAQARSSVWEHTAQAYVTEDTYDPRLGFVRRTGVEHYRYQAEYTWRGGPDDALRRYQVQVSPHYDQDTDGQEDRFTLPFTWMDLEFQSEDSISIETEWFEEHLDDSFDLSDGVTVGAGAYDGITHKVEFEANERRRITGEVRVEFGDFFGGDLFRWKVEPILIPSKHYTLRVGYEDIQAEFDGPDLNTQLYSADIDFAFNPDLSLRNVVQYDTESEGLAWQGRMHWIIEPGQDLFLVVVLGWDRTDRDSFHGTNEELIVKLSYTWRF